MIVARKLCWAAWTALVLVPVAGIAQEKKIDVAEIFARYRPLNAGVDYDTPADAKEIAACTWEWVKSGDREVGVQIRDSQGKILRKFIDATGKKGTDQWSYFKDGFEVYRDVDYNDDQKIDESRWLNAGGTRVAVIESSKIVGWRRLSAEEASKVLVQAITGGDLALLETVMATPAELEGLGLPKGLVEQAKGASGRRRDTLKDLLPKLTGWNKQTVWLRFDGVMPHIVPADAAAGMKDDVTVYENAVIFAGRPDPTADSTTIAYLQAPEMVLVGQVWKFVDMPRAFNPGKPEVVAGFDGIRSWVYREAGQATNTANPELDGVLARLAEHDATSAPILAGGEPKAIVKYHFDRIQILKDVVAKATGADQLLYNKEIVNSLAAAYQTGEYPAGLTALEAIIKQGGSLASYADFRRILAEYSIRAESETDVVKAQKAWLADLEGFLEKYAKSEEAPDALFQLASVNEFNGEEEAALKHYGTLARDFAQTEAGRKAAGALRRLGLLGNPLVLTGTDLAGSPVDIAALKGKTVLVVFWSGAAAPYRRELPELVRIQKKFQDKGLEIVGVCLDSDKATAEAFLKDNPSPWRQIFEEGGMDGRLATEFGIISLPTMILVNAEGKVVSRNVRMATEVETYLEKPIAAKPEAPAR
jgi:peroxiredoxin